MNGKYFESIVRIERLNRTFLKVLKEELEADGITAISSIEALLIHNIGRQEVSVSRVSEKGYKISTNAAYNINKLIKNGYIIKTENPYDMRNKTLILSDKGLEILEKIESIILSQEEELICVGIDDRKIENTNNILEKIEKTLSSLISI